MNSDIESRIHVMSNCKVKCRETEPLEVSNAVNYSEKHIFLSKAIEACTFLSTWNIWSYHSEY